MADAKDLNIYYFCACQRMKCPPDNIRAPETVKGVSKSWKAGTKAATNKRTRPKIIMADIINWRCIIFIKARPVTGKANRTINWCTHSCSTQGSRIGNIEINIGRKRQCAIHALDKDTAIASRLKNERFINGMRTCAPLNLYDIITNESVFNRIL